jgi:hypothetical protein
MNKRRKKEWLANRQKGTKKEIQIKYRRKIGGNAGRKIQKKNTNK